MDNHPHWWDPYSEQPYKLDPAQKPRLRLDTGMEYLKILATAIGVSPLILWRYFSLKPQHPPAMIDFAGLSVGTTPKWHRVTQDMIEDLGVRQLLVRMPVWQQHKLDEIAQFIELFPQHRFVVNILQSRDSVTDLTVWAQQLSAIFDTLSPYCRTYQIGNAINRTKWGCRHSGQAIGLFEIADQVRQSYPGLTLLGSSVIDFEPLITLRTLVNLVDYRMDGCASLLYINRRGSPYGKQYRYFDLEKKLRLNKAILSLSNNTDNTLWITETNWPLLNTKPYTPNSGQPRSTVDEQTQAIHLKHYFQVARQTGWVKRVYWWQLINPGYGLVDSRDGLMRKMPSYYAFQSLFD